MNITEFMSFDLEWFTTLPGILITGGVVVLLIALILFIASNKKDKNRNENVAAPVEEQVSNGNQPVMDNNFANGAAMGMMDVPAVPENNKENNMMINNDINNNDGINVPTVENVAPVIPTVETPVVASYNAQPTATNVVDFSAPSVETESAIPVQDPNVVDTPVVPVTDMNINVPETTPYIAPVASSGSVVVPEVTPAAVEVTPVTPAEPIVPAIQEQPVIYGGANPASVVSNPVQEKPVIYGGANPLENTTTLPRMVNHDAYGVSSAAPVIEPVSAPAPVAPVEATAPTVEATQPVVPEAPLPAIEPNIPAMPMTGAEMFATSEPVTSPAVDSGDEIETLEF